MITVILIIIGFVFCLVFGMFMGGALASASRADDISEVEIYYRDRMEEIKAERNYYLALCKDHDLLDADWEKTETINIDDCNEAFKRFLDGDE